MLRAPSANQPFAEVSGRVGGSEEVFAEAGFEAGPKGFGSGEQAGRKAPHRTAATSPNGNCLEKHQ